MTRRIVLTEHTLDAPEVLAMGPDAFWLAVHAAASASSFGLVPRDVPARLLASPADAVNRLVAAGWWEPGSAGGWRIARQLGVRTARPGAPS